MDGSPLNLLRQDPIVFFLVMAAIIEAIALHEFAHAYAADLQGDRLPRAMGRLSLNPVRHLDPLGTLLIALVGFGWGKPVEFRPQALSSQRFGPAIVALAGPGMNLLLALAAAIVYGVAFGGFSAFNEGVFPRFLEIFFSINVFLAVFNLIPLPPLDGSRLLTIFLPPSKQNIVFFLDRYGFLILLGILLFAGPTLFLPLVRTVASLLVTIAGAG